MGLANARVGFVLAEASLLNRLRAALGPWCVTGPSRWVATQALRDHAWQQAACARLLAEGARLAATFETYEWVQKGGALFRWLVTRRAAGCTSESRAGKS